MYKNPYEQLSGKITAPKITKAGFQELQFDTGQIKLNYVAGPDNGPPLVLIPAQMGMWESYQKVMAPLSKKFQVYVVDIRGHGKSSWTPGDYSWDTVGSDMRAFLENVVKQKALIAGNSSGGIIALWCAANLPHLVSAIVLEDAPVFSAEMPRFKDQDRFVYNGLKKLVDNIGDPENRDLATYFNGMEMPVSETRVKRVPPQFIRYLSKKIQKFEDAHPGQPIETGFPSTLRLLLKSLSMFDPDFARAFVDGRFYEGIDHSAALRRLQCPILVLHADWHRYPDYGLVGAMDDRDAERILELAPHACYKKIHANHVIHAFKPKQYIAAITEFAAEIQLLPKLEK
ncbi:alpha/beta fold hydrolase [Planococcus shenhongbingii]|uniref:Alpha/beta hydrolase n=1 Tax=Planococcus shenhongbingii TaxID=3058398 RepID=A0ABT8NGW8_9BACL|nr:alpha/beta hydrolase [Planococcus sp. N017]MDN7247013.1 alpha/beta hydrolase [Planococcus sp. N017]